MPNLGPLGLYQWQDVFTTVKDFTHQIPTTVSQVYIADRINQIISSYWPWIWNVNTIGPFPALNGVQDYNTANAGITIPPGDWYKGLAGRIYRTDVTPPQVQPIKFYGHLEPELQRQGSINTIQGFSYEPTVNSFRLDIPLEISGTTAYSINIDYQQQGRKVVSLSQRLDSPDRYFDVPVQGCLWGVYSLGDDPRTGTVTINRAGDKQYSGQLAVFMTALDDMKRSEDSGYALDSRWPESPMGWTRYGNPGVFPTI